MPDSSWVSPSLAIWAIGGAFLLLLLLSWRMAGRLGLLTRQLAGLERQVFALKDISAVRRAAAAFAGPPLPEFSQRLAAPAGALSLRPRRFARSSGSDLATTIGKDFERNAQAVAKMARAMLEKDRWKSPDPVVRVVLGKEVKAFGREIDLSFWKRAGNGFPDEPPWRQLRSFYTRLGGLKSEVDSLPGTPTTAQFIAVLDWAGEVLGAAEDFVDFLEKS